MLLNVLLPGQSPGERISGRSLKPVKPGTVCRYCRIVVHRLAGGSGGRVVQAEGKLGVAGRAAQRVDGRRGGVQHRDPVLGDLLRAGQVPRLAADRQRDDLPLPASTRTDRPTPPTP